MKYVRRSAEALGSEVVGGRFVRQGEMVRAGIPVPEFFCVGRNGWDDWLEPVRTELEERVFRLGSVKPEKLEAECQELRSWLEAQPLPPLLRIEIEKAATELFGDRPPLAVHACSVAADTEDATTATAEERRASFQNQTVATIEACLRRAWSASFSREAILHRAEHGLDQLGGAIAVGVERMVTAERSFVLFTRNPVTGSRETVIRADGSTGEPVHFFLDRTGSLTRQLDADQKPNGSAETALSTRELSALGAIAVKVGKLFERAQEIDGCFAGGEICLLQSRPVAIDDRERVVWDNSSITETLPGITLPLTFSFARGFYREAYTDSFRLIGVSDAEIAAHQHEFSHMIGYHDGHVYSRQSTLDTLFAVHPLFPIYRGPLRRMFGLDNSGTEGGQLWRGLAHLAWNHARLESGFEQFSTRFRNDLIAFERTCVSRLPATEALQQLRDFTDRRFRQWGVPLVNDIFAALGADLLEQIFDRWGLSAREPSLLGDLMHDEELASSRTIHHLVSLASELHANSDLFTLFESNTPDRVWRRLRQDPDHVRFLGRVNHHLHAFGHRSSDELKLELPGLRNDPSSLLSLIHQYAKDGVTTHELRASRQATRDSAERRLDKLTRRHPLRHRLIRKVLEITRSAVANQEEACHLRSQLFGTARDALGLIGQKLALAGAVHEPADIHYLSIDELDDAIEGTLVSGDVESLVALRRNQIALYRKRDAPARFVTIGPVHQGPLDGCVRAA